MNLREWSWRVALASALLLALGIIAIGVRFLLQPEASAQGFGAAAETGPYLAAKGIRDIGSGLVGLTLLATRHFRAAGWTIIAMAVIPLGDALVVLAWGGPPVLAYTVHGGTAAAMAVTGAFLIRGPQRGEPRPDGRIHHP